MPGERAEAPLLIRSGSGRRFGTLAQARADPGEAEWSLYTQPQMGAAQSGARRNSHSVFVAGRRFYLVSQAARLDAPNFRRDKETFALARRGGGAGETA